MESRCLVVKARRQQAKIIEIMKEQVVKLEGKEKVQRYRGVSLSIVGEKFKTQLMGIKSSNPTQASTVPR